ncbi:hypothetical protein N7507_004514 [Penicillium longicatenatum]|nr:hypothetical protein N7507_004514 [Penicillium longicatenatum]
MATRLLSLSLLALVVWFFVAIQVSARSIPKFQTVSLIDIGDGLLNLTSLPSGLQKREEKPTLTWEKAVKNGNGHFCNFKLITTPLDPKTKQKKTIWTQDDLNLYWTSRRYQVGDATVSRSTEKISDALDDLKLPTALPPNKGIHYEQDRSWEEDGITQWQTAGFYIAVMNPAKGMLLAEYNESPWEMTKYDDQRQPPLTRWSDVNFLMWEQLARNKKELRNIKYLIRFHIVNTNTKAMINQALTITGTSLTHYPGTVFPMSSDAGKAILGTPNGGGVAWFLVDHKNQLGVKEVESVRVFKTDGSDGEDWYHAIFNIQNAAVLRAQDVKGVYVFVILRSGYPDQSSRHGDGMTKGY